MILEITVAIATPSTLIWQTITKNKFNITLITPETNNDNNDLLVSPLLLKIAEVNCIT